MATTIPIRARPPVGSPQHERDLIARVTHAAAAAPPPRTRRGADLRTAPAVLAALAEQCLAVIAASSSPPRARLDAADQLTVVELLAQDVHDLLEARQRDRVAACRAVLADLVGADSTSGALSAVCRAVVERLGFEHVVLLRLADDGWEPWAEEPAPCVEAQRCAGATRERPPPWARPVLGRWGPVGSAPGAGRATATIEFSGEVAGLLVATPTGGRDADELDDEILGTVALRFEQVYERNAVLERAREQRSALRAASAALDRALSAVCDAAVDLDGADPADPARATHQTGDRFRALTPRQREIMDLIADGADNARIAEQLGLAEGTVKSHVKRLLRGLGVVNRSQAITAFHERAAAAART